MRKLLLLILLFSCTSEKRANWDSGASATDAFQMQQQQDIDSSTRDQSPSVLGPTDSPVP